MHISLKIFLFLVFWSLCEKLLYFIFLGKYGTQVSPLFLLHMLYISVSIWACFRVFSQPSARNIQLTVSQDQNQQILQLIISY